MQVYVLTGCGFDSYARKILGVYADNEHLRNGMREHAALGYGAFETDEFFMDMNDVAQRAPPKVT